MRRSPLGGPPPDGCLLWVPGWSGAVVAVVLRAPLEVRMQQDIWSVRPRQACRRGYGGTRLLYPRRTTGQRVR